MSLHFISCLLLLTDAPPGAAILLSDFGAFSISHPLALALHMSLTLAKYLGCMSSTSTSPSDADVSRVQDTPAGGIALAAYNLKISWNIVIDGDYILDNVANSIRDGVYACVPTLRTTTECDYCCLPPREACPPLHHPLRSLRHFQCALL